MTLLTSLFHKYFRVEFFAKQLLVPLALLAFSCSSYAILGPRLDLSGVNYVFANRLSIFSFLILAIVSIITVILWKIRIDDGVRPETKDRKVSISDFWLVLIPLTPVVQYMLNNQDILLFIDWVVITIFFVVFSAFFVVVIPGLFGKYSSTRTLMSLGLAFTFTIISMASLSKNYSWFEKGSLKIQLIFLGCVFIVSWLLLGLKNKKDIFLIVGIFFVASNFYQFLSTRDRVDKSFARHAEHPLVSQVAERRPVLAPAIYLLVYDSYVPNETMLEYGIDNSSQEQYLKDLGFVLYPHTYSIDVTTTGTMSRVLNASDDYYGIPRRGVSGDGVVHSAVKQLGYKTYGIFAYDYMFRGLGSSYDFSTPKNKSASYVLLISAILTGEFKFDIGFDQLTYSQYVETKQKTIKEISGKKVFFYSHSNYPDHSQNSGVCLPNETESYDSRLQIANLEMRQDLELLIERDPKAIIIVAGDHGPYLTKNCTDTVNIYGISEISRIDIQDRFGAFLAIRWPTEAYARYDELTVLQDLFPVVFAYLYDDPIFLNLKILPNTLNLYTASGTQVINGIIHGGIHDGEPLYLSEEK